MRMMHVPQIMTGIILEHLPSVCRGKEMWRRASYWQDVATTFEMDTKAYVYSGATGEMLSPELCGWEWVAIEGERYFSAGCKGQ